MTMRRDYLFWAIIGGIFLVYAFLQLNVVSFLATMVGLLLAVTVHECAHAWMAEQLGDPTAKYLGRVSLNPLVHLDPMGTVMMVVTAVTGVGIGWGKPVPVSPHRLRYGRHLGNGIVALAGPASNLALAALIGLGLRFAPALPPLAALIITSIAVTNIVIAMFNLIPLPPLDGHSVLLGLLSLVRARWAWRLSQFIVGLQRHGPAILILLIVVSQFMGLNLIGWLIGPPIRFFYRLILG